MPFAKRRLLPVCMTVCDALSHVTIDSVGQEYQERLASDGILKRASLPEWVRRAVFYRLSSVKKRDSS